MNKYTSKPQYLGTFCIQDFTPKYYLYLPIKLNYSNDIKLPYDLIKYKCLVDAVIAREGRDLDGSYVYISVEVSAIKSGITQKRSGWHADGFLTDDINYIYSDKLPTIFNNTTFFVDNNHSTSIKQFNEQLDESNNYWFNPKSLVRVTSSHIHRTPVPTEDEEFRQFVKISISKERYNLEGNTHNSLFDYDWVMYPRQEVRNCPINPESDYKLIG